jgi:DNA-binding LacI/PurR family transcriptional regulator
MTHLVQVGHSRAGFVDALAGHIDPINRFPVFRSLANKIGLHFPEHSWIRCSPALEDIRASVRTWARLSAPSERATVLFCTNDLTAICTTRGLLDAGLTVPQDVSLVGYDDIPLSAMMPCPLTTVAQPVEEMMKEAAKTIVGRIEGRITGTALHLALPTHLVLRESIAAPKEQIVR